MPNKGEKFICGGREFWCMEPEDLHGKITMSSGGLLTQVPAAGFDASFQKINELTVGTFYTSKEAFPGIEAGQAYSVTKIDGDRIELDGSTTIPYPLFARLF